jgi:uncharacterized protein
VKVEGTYKFEAPREIVFDILQDPEVLSKIIPGCERLNKIGDNEYEADLEIKVGPVNGKYKGKVTLSNIAPPESYTMEVSGNGPTGFVKGTGNVSLQEAESATQMAYNGDAQVGGRIASVGQRLVESTAKALIKQSLDGVNEFIKVKVQAQNQPAAADSGGAAVVATPVVEYKPPTQMEFAAGVAKEVAADLVPAKRRPVLLVGVVVLLIVLFILLRRNSGKKSKN